jgi:hypothetical protein
MDIVEVHGETRSNLISVTLFNLVSVEACKSMRPSSPDPLLRGQFFWFKSSQRSDLLNRT